MIKKTVTILLFAISIFPLTACFKLQVNPEGIVEDTVTAGKDLNKPLKRKKDGTEERLYSHTVVLQPDADDQQVGRECMDYRNTSINASSEKEPLVLESGTEIIKSESGNKVKCSMRVEL